MDETSALHVLVVEDEMILAMELEAGLEDMGHRVMGPFPTIQRTLARLESGLPDVALLDVNVAGERVTPVARVLLTAGIPFVLVTGYTGLQLTEPELRDAPRFNKPLDVRQLGDILAGVGGAGG